MAGSTAGWWPSDRDRFPPRFLLPPSLQTHNCIISTHLVSATVPLNIPRPLFLSLSLPFSPTLPPLPPVSFFLFLFLFPHCLPTLRSPPSRSDPMRAFALAPLSSPLVHPTDQPVDRFSLFIIIYPHLLSSFARKSCHTRETAHRLLRSSFLRRFSP